jgi:ribosomal protein L18E
MTKTVQHPLEANIAVRAEFEKLKYQKQKNSVAVWRAIVEALTGGLPTWATRQPAGRKKLSRALQDRAHVEAAQMTTATAPAHCEA